MTALTNLASNAIPDKFERFAMDIGDDLSALAKFNPRRADKLMLEIRQLVFDAQADTMFNESPLPSTSTQLTTNSQPNFQPLQDITNIQNYSIPDFSSWSDY